MVFNEAAPYYNERLKEAGYSEAIKYEGNANDTRPRSEMDPRNPQANTTNTQQDQETRNQSTPARSKKKRNRNRKVIHFNPPF